MELVDGLLRRVVVSGLDVDVVSVGLVRGFRVSGKTVYIFVGYGAGGCVSSRLLGAVALGAVLDKVRRLLVDHGFEKVVFIDAVSGRELRV